MGIFKKKLIPFLKEHKQFVAGVAILFAVSFLYNTLSPYTTDDYGYMFSAVTGDRITNVFQIFPSLWDDYLNIHGRVVPHFFLQIFLIGPKWIFNIVNAGMYVALIWLMLSVTKQKVRKNLLFWIAVPVALWTYVPAYGQVFFWMSGAVNYSWCYVFALIYLKVYISLYFQPEKLLTKKQLTGLCIYSFFFGAYSELVSFPVVFVSFLLLCLVMKEKGTIKGYWTYAIPMVTAAAGYLTMLLSPAQGSRKGDLALGAIFKKFIDIFETYYQVAETMLVVWAILLVIAICYSVNRKKIIVSIALVVINFISMAMLSVASYSVARHYANSVIFLLTAILVLMQALCEKGTIRCVPYCICAYVLVTSVWGLWEGTYDIYSVHTQHMQREAYIYEQRDSGNADVVYVPRITAATKYSCKYDLLDMQINDTEPWPNTAIAKYYGVKEIYGIE
ncbi:MAG: hypothetical protein IJZ23_09095 [Roseburia sp.]|nr:hypothetical protein [Roseburia sp.]